RSGGRCWSASAQTSSRSRGAWTPGAPSSPASPSAGSLVHRSPPREHGPRTSVYRASASVPEGRRFESFRGYATQEPPAVAPPGALVRDQRFARALLVRWMVCLTVCFFRAESRYDFVTTTRTRLLAWAFLSFSVAFLPAFLPPTYHWYFTLTPL